MCLDINIALLLTGLLDIGYMNPSSESLASVDTGPSCPGYQSVKGQLRHVFVVSLQIILR